jgi:hypothetical protein
MRNFSGGVGDVFRRVIYPGFMSTWNRVRDLTGRQRRLRNAADSSSRTAEKRRQLYAWNQSHDR